MFNLNYIITISLLTPFIGVLFIKSIEKRIIKLIALNYTNICFLNILLLSCFFNKSLLKFQFFYKIPLILLFNLNIVFSVDSILLLFLLLTIFFIAICLLLSWKTINILLKQYLIIFLIFLLIYYGIMVLFIFNFYLKPIGFINWKLLLINFLTKFLLFNLPK